ncbi:hypothetical protein Hdeb2414_s0018g00523231 [Helianthus debilis subsp. tardiflorus]
MFKDLSQVPSTSQAVFLGFSRAVTYTHGPHFCQPSRYNWVRAVSLNCLCRLNWSEPFQLAPSGYSCSGPFQHMVRAVSAGSEPFELYPSRYSCLMTVQCVVRAGSTCCSSRLTICRIYLPSECG